MGFLKRGEISSGFLISVILGIIAFGLAVYLIMRAFSGGDVLIDDVCKFSVLTRATNPVSDLSSAFQTPIKCSTKKYCITNGKKGDCSQFAGEKELSLIKFPNDDGEAAKVVEKVNADQMYACWKMMGEGKLDLLRPAGAFSSAAPSCFICSRVGFGSDLATKGEQVFGKVDLNGYLVNNKPEGSDKSYLEIFSGRKAIPQEIKNELSGEITDKEKKVDEVAYIFAQVNVDEPLDKLENVALGSSLIVFGGTQIPVLGAAAKGVLTTLPGAIATLGTIGLASGLAWANTENNAAFSASYCGDFTTGVKEGGGRRGCSIVTAVNYDNSDKINTICSGGLLGSP